MPIKQQQNNKQQTTHTMENTNTQTTSIMENANTNTNLTKRVASLIRYCNTQMEGDMEKLQENYTHYFSWVGERIWKETFKLNHYEMILNKFNTDFTHQAFEVLEMYIAHQKSICLQSYNVRTESSNALTREASTWEFQCRLEIIAELEKLIN